MDGKKVKIEICCGTTCYMLGASSLLKLEESLPEEWRDSIEISAIPCMEACSDSKAGGAPFIRINGVLRGHATVESVYQELFRLIGQKGN